MPCSYIGQTWIMWAMQLYRSDLDYVGHAGGLDQDHVCHAVI